MRYPLIDRRERYLYFRFPGEIQHKTLECLPHISNGNGDHELLAGVVHRSFCQTANGRIAHINQVLASHQSIMPPLPLRDPDQRDKFMLRPGEVFQKWQAFGYVADLGGMGDTYREYIQVLTNHTYLNNERMVTGNDVFTLLEILDNCAALREIAAISFDPTQYAQFCTGLACIIPIIRNKFDGLPLRITGEPGATIIQEISYEMDRNGSELRFGSPAFHAARALQLSLKNGAFYPFSALREPRKNHQCWGENMIPYENAFAAPGRQVGQVANPHLYPTEDAVEEAEAILANHQQLSSAYPTREVASPVERRLTSLISEWLGEINDPERTHNFLTWIGQGVTLPCEPIDTNALVRMFGADAITDRRRRLRIFNALSYFLDGTYDGLYPGAAEAFGSMREDPFQSEAPIPPINRIYLGDVLRFTGLLKKVIYDFYPQKVYSEQCPRIDQVVNSIIGAFGPFAIAKTPDELRGAFGQLDPHVQTSPAGKAFAECIGLTN